MRKTVVSIQKRILRPTFGIDFIRYDCGCGRPHIRLGKEPSPLIGSLVRTWAAEGVHAIPSIVEKEHA